MEERKKLQFYDNIQYFMQKQSNYKVHRSQFLSKPIYGSLKNKRDNAYFFEVPQYTMRQCEFLEF